MWYQMWGEYFGHNDDGQKWNKVLIRDETEVADVIWRKE